MQQLKYIFKTSMIAVVAGVLISVMPMAALAQAATDTTSDENSTDTSQQSTESQPEENLEENNEPEQQTESQTTQESEVGPTEPTGPTKPTGASSNTYTYNEETGLWENEHYTWDPATGQTKPKQKQEYSYNPNTGMWDTTEWYYSPETGKYEPNTVSVSQNPNLLSSSNSNGGIYNTGPNSNNQINMGGQTNGNFDLFFDASISNKIGQMSRSGDASVQGNTLGGDALTGDALTLLNLLNMIQSSWGELGSANIATFMANINGDIVGDLLIDPNQINGGSGNSDVDINVNANAQIDNEIDVTAQSGNATVSGNTTGGSATSGDAQAIVNLINMINSAIYANQSFVGILNINGNLDGDILLPSGFLEAIIAATGPNSNNQINSEDNDSLNVSVNNDSSIINNVNAEAQSGNATVSGNTTGGSATSGDANTNIVLLNLTGRQVVAKNAMLVFVNVLGSWVGLILDAPAGSYAVAATGPNSNNTINSSDNDNVDVNINRTSRINNDINASAGSGDATVSNNTNAGGANTGDASVAVNAANLIDSTFHVSDWFGILFINVFGTWNGSFGVDTDAGNPKVGGGMGAGSSGGEDGAVQGDSTEQDSNVPQVFSFVPKNNGSSNSVATASTADQVADSSGQASSSAVSDQSNEQGDGQAQSTGGGNLWLPITFGALAIILLFGERIMAFIRRPGA